MSDIDARVTKLEEEIKSIMSRPTYSSTPAWHHEVAELRLAIEEIRTGKRSQAAEPLPIRAPARAAEPAAQTAAAPAAAAMAHGHDSTHAHHDDSSYMTIFVWLTIFTLIELGMAKVVSGLALAFGLTAFAVAKVLLVAFYYMHVSSENKVFRALLTIPIILVIIMVALLIPDATTPVDGYFFK